ncbi:MAG: DJ-1/PfpI family protein [Porphyromonadaceae bacterium]|nr:DJ-1/PfpI family protein [Porphyromonadaceae bacterium]
MAKNVYVFLAEGFEEIEAVTTIDLLRRAGLSTTTIAVGNSLEVSGAHHITLRADKPLDEVDLSRADALVLPGGLPGVDNLNSSEVLRSMLRQMYDSGRLVAAICAAPMILGQLGILKGRHATCYPSFERHLTGYKTSEQKVITDGHVITACSAGVAVDFGLEIIKYLLGDQEALRVAGEIIYR